MRCSLSLSLRPGALIQTDSVLQAHKNAHTPISRYLCKLLHQEIATFMTVIGSISYLAYRSGTHGCVRVEGGSASFQPNLLTFAAIEA